MAKNGRHNLAELLNYVYEIARLTASSVLSFTTLAFELYP